MERLLGIGLIIGIPLIIACIAYILYAICHSPFIRMNYEKGLPYVQTLIDKYGNVNTKRKQKAWLIIHSEIVYAAKHGEKHVQIWPEDYIDIPYDEFEYKLESHGYVLEANSQNWYERRLSIDVSWEY